MNPTVSIIVPCYNHAQYLDECLASVVNQTYINWECIIVNDGSIDNTEEIAKKWSENDSRFRYIKQENSGVARARNFGITKANGVFILPLDGDDKMDETYVEHCYNAFVSHPDATLVYGDIFRFGEINGKWDLPPYNFEKLLQRNLMVCTVMFRKLDWKRIGGYDERMVLGIEDWEFLINLLKDGGHVIKLNNCSFFYRIKDQSRNADLFNSESNVMLMKDYVFNKHRSLYTNKTSYELYIENNYLRKKIDSFASNISLVNLVKLLVKKILRIK